MIQACFFTSYTEILPVLASKKETIIDYKSFAKPFVLIFSRFVRQFCRIYARKNGKSWFFRGFAEPIEAILAIVSIIFASFTLDCFR